MESGIQLKESIGIRNPSPTDKESVVQYLESEEESIGIWNPVSGIRSVESRMQDSLGFPYMGRTKVFIRARIIAGSDFFSHPKGAIIRGKAIIQVKAIISNIAP